MKQFSKLSLGFILRYRTTSGVIFFKQMWSKVLLVKKHWELFFQADKQALEMKLKKTEDDLSRQLSYAQQVCSIDGLVSHLEFFILHPENKNQAFKLMLSIKFYWGWTQTLKMYCQCFHKVLLYLWAIKIGVNQNIMYKSEL